VFVIRGNSAIFKCQVPSYVGDHIEITEWISTENDTYKMKDFDGLKITSIRLNLFRNPSPEIFQK
jgi:hypothetical protein